MRKLPINRRYSEIYDEEFNLYWICRKQVNKQFLLTFDFKENPEDMICTSVQKFFGI